MRRLSGCTFRTLYFVNALQPLKKLASDELASGELASDDVIFRSTFFRRTMLLTFQERFQSDALQASI